MIRADKSVEAWPAKILIARLRKGNGFVAQAPRDHPVVSEDAPSQAIHIGRALAIQPPGQLRRFFTWLANSAKSVCGSVPFWGPMAPSTATRAAMLYLFLLPLRLPLLLRSDYMARTGLAVGHAALAFEEFAMR